MAKKLSIIMPAWNEEKRIAETLQQYLFFFSKKYGTDFEIFVVLDPSKDKTEQIIKEFMRKFPGVLNYKKTKTRLGKGRSIIEGFKIVQGELIGFVDADNATKAPSFNSLIQKLGENDGVIGSRYLPGSNLVKKQTKFRIFLSRGYNFLIRLLFGLKYKDTQCGAKIYRKKPLKEIVPKIGVTRFGFDVDILYRLARNDYKVIEAPVKWEDKEESKLKVEVDVPRLLYSLIRLRLEYSVFDRRKN